jgi:hypothetical protein
MSPTARAQTAEAAPAFATGASLFVAGFLVGGTVLGTSPGSAARDNAGWLTIEGGFTIAPLAAHAIVGEWGRGLVFSALPAAATAVTAALFAHHPGTIEHGELAEQRVMWAAFGVGLLVSAAGIVDAAIVRTRPTAAVSIAPLVGADRVGLRIVGAL